MKLTKDQEAAVAAIKEWWEGDDLEFVLSGEPGTGKTFVAQYATEQLLGAVVKFTAPTNEAVEALRGHLSGNVSLSTTYVALGLSLKTRGSEQVLAKVVETDLGEFNLLAVDESSFVGKALRDPENPDHWQLLEFIREEGIRVLWIGDGEQLPPINEETSPVFQEELPGYHLTEVVRHSGAILDFVRALRDWTPTKPFPEFKPPVEKLKPRQLWEYIGKEDSFRRVENGQMRIICWRNKRCDMINEHIRGMRFGEATAKKHKYCPGDQILFAAPLRIDRKNPPHEQDLQRFWQAKDFGTVVSTNAKGVVQRVDTRYLWDIECYELEIQFQNGSNKKVLAPTKAGEKALKALMNETAAEAKRLSGKARFDAWEKFHALKTVTANLRHGYAMTGHRAQGSSIPYVIVDSVDILMNRSRVVARKNFYVSCSRAQKGLVVLTNRAR